MFSKASYINYLSMASISFGNITKSGDAEYLTYFTSAGIVIGKQKK